MSALHPPGGPGDGPHAGRSPLAAVTLLGPAVLYVAAVFAVGSVPVRGTSVSVSDKVLHLVVFGLMVLPMLRAARFVLRAPELGARLRWAAGSATLAGGLLEVWQALLPHRSGEFLDWVADAVGAVLVAGLVWVTGRLVGQRGRPEGPAGRQGKVA